MFTYHTYISWTKTKLLKYYRGNMKGGYEIQQVDFMPSLILPVALLKKFLKLTISITPEPQFDPGQHNHWLLFSF